MKLAAFIGKSVIDRSGRDLGSIHDVRLVKDGPIIGSFGAGYRVHSLIAGSPSIGIRLGLHRDELKGPWPLKAIFRHLHGRIVSVKWDTVWSIEEDVVRLRSNFQAGGREAGVEDDHPASGFLDAGFQLLDRQVVDVEGRMAGKVDDLAVEFPPEPRMPPLVVAILMGPGALASRTGGRLGTSIARAYGRVLKQPRPTEVSFGVVKRIDNHVELVLPRDDLEITAAEDWLWENVISRIPGSGS